ncbi:FAM192A family protein [Megaselia abdita]
MSTGFVTETEAAELRKKRQEEWEKVRRPEDPEERPEEPFDGRSLYDRLKENKDKKEMELAESQKLKNLIRGLDDDEVQFLDLVDQKRQDAERQQHKDEEKELKEYRERVKDLQEKSIDLKLQNEVASTKTKTIPAASRLSQKSLLGGVIKKRKADLEEADSSTPDNHNETSEEPKKAKTLTLTKGALQCIGILPGIGKYNDSSDSEASENSGDEDCVKTRGILDIVSRKTCSKDK